MSNFQFNIGRFFLRNRLCSTVHIWKRRKFVLITACPRAWVISWTYGQRWCEGSWCWIWKWISHSMHGFNGNHIPKILEPLRVLSDWREHGCSLRGVHYFVPFSKSEQWPTHRPLNPNYHEKKNGTLLNRNVPVILVDINIDQFSLISINPTNQVLANHCTKFLKKKNKTFFLCYIFSCM